VPIRTIRREGTGFKKVEYLGVKKKEEKTLEKDTDNKGPSY